MIHKTVHLKCAAKWSKEMGPPLHHMNYRFRQEAKSDIFNYIEWFYNPK